jgi:rfaE bifunctional protein nucleotidyltransferase chain/domain
MIIHEKQIDSVISQLKSCGKKIVTTNGCFDILHVGHVRILKKAKEEGDVLIVLINSDASVKRFKGENRPIIPEMERAEMLDSLECVDNVIIFEEDDPIKILERIKPAIHVKGGTFVPERIEKESNALKEIGTEFKMFEIEEGLSTTNLLNKVLDLYNKNN